MGVAAEDIIADRADDNMVTLRVLAAVEENAELTQRSLAREMGVALGLAHAYLKRCVKKGYVKISQVPSNRYAYYLTPHGFAEKTRLTAEYLNQSFRFFRLAKEQVSALMDECAAKGWRRIAIAGGGDLAEIAVLCAGLRSIELVALIGSRESEIGVPAVADIGDLDGGIDAVIVTSLTEAQDTWDRLRALFPSDRVLAPRLLKVRATQPEPV